MIWALGFAAAALIGWAVIAYNRFVGLRQRAEGAWADIDAQLKRRHDLVPALVETVKGYAAHERQTLQEVVERRSGARQSPSGVLPDAARVGSENLLSHSLKHLFALAEAYPDLRASDRFRGLQEQLIAIEDQLQLARRYFNAVVRDWNTAVQRFPDVVVARVSGFAVRDFFELDSVLERDVVAIDLDAS